MTVGVNEIYTNFLECDSILVNKVTPTVVFDLYDSKIKKYYCYLFAESYRLILK